MIWAWKPRVLCDSKFGGLDKRLEPTSTNLHSTELAARNRLFKSDGHRGLQTGKIDKHVIFQTSERTANCG